MSKGEAQIHHTRNITCMGTQVVQFYTCSH